MERRGTAPGSGPPGKAGLSHHEIERAVARLNAWFAGNRRRIPTYLNWRRFRRERHLPRFQAVPTTAIVGWKAEELRALFRVRSGESRDRAGVVEVPVELLVTDKSVAGEFLDVKALMKAAAGVVSAPLPLGRFSPRLWGFWSAYSSLAEEITSYINGIRLRVDAATAVPHDQRRVFEDFNVPLENGQQTALGGNCLFILEQARPPGATPFWRFTVTRDGEVIVGPQMLGVRAIYHQDRVLAVIKRIGESTVTLGVLTSEGAPESTGNP
jgi:hypothetical protein